MKKYLNNIICFLLVSVVCFACTKPIEDVNQSIYEESGEETNVENNDSKEGIKYYDHTGKPIRENLFYDDGKLNYIDENGEIVKNDEIDFDNVIYRIDVDGNVLIEQKYNKKSLYVETETEENNGKLKFKNSLKNLYFTVDYTKRYGYTNGKLYLLDRDLYVIDNYKNQFYTYQEELEELSENINMPEDNAGVTYFDYNGDINTKLKEVTFYFFEDSSIAYDGLYEINGKRYLFDTNGFLVKNDIYEGKDGNIYLSDYNGEVISDEGIHDVYLYDEEGNLNITASEVAVLEGTSGCGDQIIRKYYVDKEGKIVLKSLIQYNGDIYCADDTGRLIKNSYVSNRLYFDNNYKLVYDGEMNFEELLLYSNYIWYKNSHSSNSKKYSVISEKKFNDQQSEVLILKENKNNVIEKDYESIITYGDDENNIKDIDGNIIKNRFIIPYGAYHDMNNKYYDNEGNRVKNKIINIGNDKYLISNLGYTIPAYKITRRIINKYFSDKTAHELEKYIGYFTSYDGKLCEEYEELCKKIRNEKIITEDNARKILLPHSIYEAAILKIKAAENSKTVETIAENGKAIFDNDLYIQFPTYWKSLVADLDDDNIKEIIVFKKDWIIDKRDNIMNDVGDSITPRRYFIGVDIYKYNGTSFDKILNRKLEGIFIRDCETLRIGYKKNLKKSISLYVEWRGLNYLRGDGSFVEVKKFEYANNELVPLCSDHEAGSSVGEWVDVLHDRVDQMGIDFTENNFYDYQDSYLEKDPTCNLILGLNRSTEQNDENYETEEKADLEIYELEICFID